MQQEALESAQRTRPGSSCWKNPFKSWSSTKKFAAAEKGGGGVGALGKETLRSGLHRKLFLRLTKPQEISHTHNLEKITRNALVSATLLWSFSR